MMNCKIKILTLMAAIFLIVPAVSWGGHCLGAACTENIVATKHNLAANTDVASLPSIVGATGVCVFCHTPHGATTAGGIGGEAPLWNRAVPEVAGYTMYNSPNTDEVALEPRGVSLACLSCHDGVIALDALVNAPGSGGLTVLNRGAIAEGGSIPGLDFDGPGVELAGAQATSLSEATRPDGAGGFLGGLLDLVNPGAGEGMAPFPNLTQDLTDDHPISIRMPTADPQFDDARDSLTVGQIRPILRDSGPFAGGAQVLPTDPRNQIRLYNTTGLPSVATDAVECASCHNPHTPRTTFLRLPSIVGGTPLEGEENPAGGLNLNHEPNQGSLICITCHQK